MRILLLFYFIVGTLYAKPLLIQEMESLREDLSADDQARLPLTLKLADVYFDESIGESAEQMANMDNYRERAIGLYHDALKEISGDQKTLQTNIHFQLARLYNKMINATAAMKYYQMVLDDTGAEINIKNESALSIAEMLEAQGHFKRAEHYFAAATTFCTGMDTCNYAYHKKSWLHFRMGELEQAIVDVEKSLVLSNLDLREESLRDYIQFVSHRNSHGQNEYIAFQKLAVKHKRPKILEDLTFAFFAQGNRLAGTYLLSQLHESKPNLYYHVRLIEENMGFENWDKVSTLIQTLNNYKAKDLPKDAKQFEEIQKMLQRIIVQLDRHQGDDINNYTKYTILAYLKFYPQDELREKMQQGWLAKTEDEKSRFDQLSLWIKELSGNKVYGELTLKMRHSRLALAQSLSLANTIIEDASFLAMNSTEDSNGREYQYILGKAYYDQKKYEKALPIFEVLIKDIIHMSDELNLDKYAVFAQNLILDIYNQQKNYEGIMITATTWLAHPLLVNHEENANMHEIRNQAQFEQAVSRGDSLQALETFYDFCFKGIYSDKSCVNAKVLSIKLKNQQMLVSLLEKENAIDELIAEYEAMGRFADAATLIEKHHLKNSEIQTWLKVAMLYELDQRNDDRNRIYVHLKLKFQKEGKIHADLEPAIYKLMSTAGVLSEKDVSLPWSTSYKIKLINDSSLASHTHKSFLLAQTTYSGPLWSKYVLTEVEELYKKQKQISFYGAYGETKFKRRVAAIEKMVGFIKVYLEGADLKTRIYLLDYATAAYQNFATEIYNSPIPKEIDDETLAEISMQLQELATPYQSAAVEYEKLRDDQMSNLAKNENVTLRTVLDYASLIEIREKQLVAGILDYSAIAKLKSRLRLEPYNKKIISQLRSIYQVNGHEHLASYFEGRLQDLASKRGKI